MTAILVLTALELEARGLARQLELACRVRLPFPVYERASAHATLRVAPVGFRAVFLPARSRALLAGVASPLVVSAGTCGALAPGLRVGDLILPETVLGPAGERLSVTPRVQRAAVELARVASTEILLTSSHVVATPEAKAERWRATGAAAVDLESAIIVEWASRHGYSSLVIRAVSDTADQHLPADLVGLVTRGGRLRKGRAAALALTRPRTIPDALMLGRGTGRALRSVARLVATLAG